MNDATTQRVQFDPKLNYYNSSLFIVTNKAAPSLRDLKKQKPPLHLEAYLNQPKQQHHETQVNAAALIRSEQDLK